MKNFITTLISERPTFLEGFTDGFNYHITADYSPTGWNLMFVFDEYKLIEIMHVDDVGGKSVLFGESIATSHLKMVELSCAMNQEISNYKNQIR